jgi:hypothetical protein
MPRLKIHNVHTNIRIIHLGTSSKRIPMPPTVSYSFCLSLFSQENIKLDFFETPSSEDQDSTLSLIRDVDLILRDDAPYQPPPLDYQAALWSLAVLQWSCRTLVNRLDSRTDIPNDLSALEPSGLVIDHHWSVDLGLRFLADLVRKTSAAASNDRLIATLIQIGARWPYSSIGTTADWQGKKIELLLSNPCMRHMLLDRLSVRGDALHSRHPLVTKHYQSHIAMPPTIH